MKRAFLWGRVVKGCDLDSGFARRLCEGANRRREKAGSIPMWKRIKILHKVGRLWEGRSSRYVKRARKIMPVVSGFSQSAVDRTLEIIPRLFEEKALKKRLSSELGRDDALDTWFFEPGQSNAVRAFPLGSVLHVASGNIFIGCIDSILMSLLTGNVTILKTSSSDTEFPFLFAESIMEADPEKELSGSLAIVYWESGRREIEDGFKRSLQGIVVWGGEEAVASYRQGLGLGCKLVEFGPKISFAVLSGKGLLYCGIREAARRLAWDTSLWDQAACASPQTVFMQGPKSADFIDALAKEMEALTGSLPPGELDPDDAVEVLSHRQRALVESFLGRGKVLSSKGDLGWTIFWRKKGALQPSPLHRFIHIRPYRNIKDLVEKIRPCMPYLQSAGILVHPSETASYTEALAREGVHRIPELGRMLESETGEPHDGRYPLAELVRWVSGPKGSACVGTAEALANFVSEIREASPFYKRRFRKVRISPDSLGWFSSLPLLEKRDIYDNTPPRSRDILTDGDLGGNLVFASGGSTGEPKFCFYTQKEFEETARWLGWGMVQGGLSPNDIVANLFVAGNLWSSFLAIWEAAKKIKVFQLPVGGTTDPDLTIQYIRFFGANVIIGLPATILELSRHIQEKGIEKLPVRKIFYGGEHVSEEIELNWKRVFGSEMVRSAGYASVDAGLIGFQCAFCRGREHHVAGGLQFVEIVSPETGRPAASGEAGEIVVTNFRRKLMPVVRYRTGDLGKWIPGRRPCPCGCPSDKFALLGRCDDQVNVGGAHFDVSDVAKAIESCPGLSFFYQVVVELADGSGDRMTVRVERAGAGYPGSSDEKLTAGRLKKALLEASSELRDSVNRGWLKVPVIEILKPGSLHRNPRTGKVRRVVDRRQISNN